MVNGLILSIKNRQDYRGFIENYKLERNNIELGFESAKRSGNLQSFSFDSGVYLLELFVFKPIKIEVGARGKEVFPPGYYYYAGTAQNNLNARIQRHKKNDVNKHWHIDYLLEEAVIQDVYAWPESAEWECKLAAELLDKEEAEMVSPGFGASDCSCDTHLIYFPQPLAAEIIEEVVQL